MSARPPAHPQVGDSTCGTGARGGVSSFARPSRVLAVKEWVPQGGNAGSAEDPTPCKSRGERPPPQPACQGRARSSWGCPARPEVAVDDPGMWKEKNPFPAPRQDKRPLSEAPNPGSPPGGGGGSKSSSSSSRGVRDAAMAGGWADGRELRVVALARPGASARAARFLAPPRPVPGTPAGAGEGTRAADAPPRPAGPAGPASRAALPSCLLRPAVPSGYPSRPQPSVPKPRRGPRGHPHPNLPAACGGRCRPASPLSPAMAASALYEVHLSPGELSAVSLGGSVPKPYRTPAQDAHPSSECPDLRSSWQLPVHTHTRFKLFFATKLF